MNPRFDPALAGALALALVFSACGTDDDTNQPGGAAPGPDAGALDSVAPDGPPGSVDASVEADTGAAVDASDGAAADSATEDAPYADSQPSDSAGDAPDDATSDASAPDSALDSGADDAIVVDAPADAALDATDAMTDASPDTTIDAPFDGSGDDAAQDAQNTDATPDSSAGDAADGSPGSDEVWVEIDYMSAYTPQSPDWSFSPTPGWGAAQWAMQGDTWPEAWDRWNNMVVENDPIGQSLTIGSSSELQLMIGLEELVGYDSMVVRLEGRSKATSSSVQFDVYNPLNGCGASGQMSQDWTPDVVELDLAQCAVVGAGVQAVRVSPTNGSIALLRMRVTLRGARW